MGLKKVYVTSDGSYRDDNSWDNNYLSGYLPLSRYDYSRYLFARYDDYSFSKLPIISILEKALSKEKEQQLVDLINQLLEAEEALNLYYDIISYQQRHGKVINACEAIKSNISPEIGQRLISGTLNVHDLKVLSPYVKRLASNLQSEVSLSNYCNDLVKKAASTDVDSLKIKIQSILRSLKDKIEAFDSFAKEFVLDDKVLDEVRGMELFYRYDSDKNDKTYEHESWCDWYPAGNFSVEMTEFGKSQVSTGERLTFEQNVRESRVEFFKSYVNMKFAAFDLATSSFDLMNNMLEHLDDYELLTDGVQELEYKMSAAHTICSYFNALFVIFMSGEYFHDLDKHRIDAAVGIQIAILLSNYYEAYSRGENVTVKELDEQMLQLAPYYFNYYVDSGVSKACYYYNPNFYPPHDDEFFKNSANFDEIIYGFGFFNEAYYSIRKLIKEREKKYGSKKGNSLGG